MIRLKHLGTFHGPSIAATAPVVVVSLAIDRESLPALRANGLALFARLGTPPPSHPEAQPAEADIADILLTLSLSWLNRRRGNITERKVLSAGGGGAVCALGYHVPRISLLALDLAVDLVSNGHDYSDGDIEQKIIGLIRHCVRGHPDYQAHMLMNYARSRDIPFLPFMPGTKYWQYGWGARSRVFMESMTHTDGAIAHNLAGNKAATKAAMQALGMPVADHVMVTTIEQAQTAAQKIGFPCVVKPIDSGGGRGISANVIDPSELSDAFASARTIGAQPIMVERRIEGHDYRLMTIAGKYVFGVRRDPASVTGDGHSTVAMLIRQENSGRTLNPAMRPGPIPIKLDEMVERQLAKQGYDYDSIPPAGHPVILRSNSNLSAGGVAVDVTDDVHPVLRAMAEHMAQTLGFEVGSFDYMSRDISLSPWEQDGAFIEMNTMPGLDLCTASGSDIGRLLDPLFGALGRIPVTLVISDEAPPPETWAGSLREGDAVVAGNRIQTHDATFVLSPADDWSAIATALRNRTLQRLEVHVTRAEILSRGLPLDRFDRVTVGCTCLPPAWLALLQRSASTVIIERERAAQDG